MESLDRLCSVDGWILLKKIVNGLAFEAYTKMLSEEDSAKANYQRGFVGGLEALLQNIEEKREDLRSIINEERELENTPLTLEEKRAKDLGIGVRDEDV